MKQSKNYLLIAAGIAAVGLTTWIFWIFFFIKSYPAKFVCGVMPFATTTKRMIAGPFFGSVNPGKYTTSVNILNPWSASTTFRKDAVLAPREPKFGTMASSVIMELPARGATSADCYDIYSLLGMQASSTDYVEGFIDIRSKNNLNIEVIYTAQNLQADGTPLETSSIDVEKVLKEDVPRQCVFPFSKC